MTPEQRRKLRELADKSPKHGEWTTERNVADALRFRDRVGPDEVLALLDENDALRARLSETVRERDELSAYRDSLIATNTQQSIDFLKLRGTYRECCESRTAVAAENDALRAELDAARTILKAQEDRIGPRLDDDPVAVAKRWNGNSGHAEPDFDMDPEDAASFLAGHLIEMSNFIAANLPHGQCPGDTDAWQTALRQLSTARADLIGIRRTNELLTRENIKQAGRIKQLEGGDLVGKLMTDVAVRDARIAELELVRDVAAGILGADDDDRVSEIRVHFSDRPSMYLRNALAMALDDAERP